MTERASARKARARKVFDVEVTGFGLVTVRKVDVVGLIMCGAIPLHLLAAMTELQGKLPAIQKDPKLLFEMPEEESAAVYELLRRYACEVVIDPKIVMTDDGNQDHMPVEMLDTDQLLEIWKAAPPASSLIDAATAKEFPGGEPTDVPNAAPDGGEVRPTPERLGSSPEVEAITG